MQRDMKLKSTLRLSTASGKGVTWLNRACKNEGSVANAVFLMPCGVYKTDGDESTAYFLLKKEVNHRNDYYIIISIYRPLTICQDLLGLDVN